MQYSVKQIEIKKQKTDCMVIAVFADGELSAAAKEVDAISGGLLTKLIKQGDITGDIGHALLLHDVKNMVADRVLVMGCGKAAELNARNFRKVITQMVNVLKSTAVKEVACYLTELLVGQNTVDWKIQQAVQCCADALYIYKDFKTNKPVSKTKLQKIIFNVASAVDSKKAENALKQAMALVTAMSLAKDLGNAPSNHCTPTYMANIAVEKAAHHKIKATVLDEKDMKKLGMGALLAVAQGSHQEARLVALEYYGAGKNQAPVGLVGKGVTFDTGGISLKPGPGMEEMKFDMCGAATVLGVITAAAELKLPINVVGVMALTENMPGGRAIKPGDVVTSMSGQTIEILNTDAEGRLILSDALTYCEKFKPDTVIDIATLTGAIIITLGSVASGVMGNDDALLDELKAVGETCGDRIWPLPLWDEYQEGINGSVADVANLGPGMESKSIYAGCFLARFAKKFKWAHLDVAGTAWKSGKEARATGRPVPLLLNYLIERSMDKAKKHSKN